MCEYDVPERIRTENGASFSERGTTGTFEIVAWMDEAWHCS